MNTILATIDLTQFLPFAIFGAIAIGAWVIADFLFFRKTRTDARLDKMRQQARGEVVADKGEKKNHIAKLLENASPSMGTALKPKNEKEASKLKKKLDSAGFRSEAAPAMFSTLKMISALFGFVVGGGLSLLGAGLTTWALLYTIICAGIFLFIPELVLTLIAKSRKEKVFLGLPDALDLMVVCVEAGLGLDQAMRRVSDELDSVHPVIAEEFKICNQQLQMGSTREVVLTDLGERNGVDDLQTLSSIMIQVDKFGTSVGKALRTQSHQMRTRRRQIAEEKAAKTAVKLIFPLVLFIFPGIFVVLVGPAAITMVNEMLPAMQR